jgi:mannose-6-phosphate isomerase-like protein (cupin superfamily)
MKEAIHPFRPESEYYFQEGCHIIEMLNSPEDPAVSIARARVAPGVTTLPHRLKDITERYVILEGKGRMRVGSLSPQEVIPGDVVLIPPDCTQSITNIGTVDLVFLAICSPRFIPEAYSEVHDSPKRG